MAQAPATPLARPPWITRFATRDGLLLHHDLTGRVLRLRGAGLDVWRRFASPGVAADDPTVAALVDGGFLVGPGAEPWAIVGPRHPVRGRWATWYDHPDGSVTLAEQLIGGDGGWQPRRLNPVEAFLWRGADGTRTTGALLGATARRFGPDLAQKGLMALLRWTSGQLQLLKMLDAPIDAAPDPPPHFFAYVDDRPLSDDDQASPAVDLDAYHRRAITDADVQFDDRETTVSHLLRYPTATLQGSTFGARLIERLKPDEGARVLEVGGGTGWLARRALDARPDLDWTIVDLSPALLRAQRDRLGADARGVHGDAMALPIADGVIDLLVSNEVIADLPAAVVDPADPPSLVTELGVRPTAKRVTNVGALRFLTEIHRVLRLGGVAWISEYGDLDREPVEATHLDHPEVGIEFGVLLKAARTLGFAAAEVVDVMDDLRFADTPTLASPPAQFAALRALMPALGAAAPEKRAYDPIAFGELCGDAIEPRRLKSLAFAGARTRLMTFPTERVRALVLRR